MLNDITIGQYYPLESIIHKLDPRVKFMFTFVFIILLFLVKNFYGFLFSFIALAVVIILSKIPVSYILKGLKPLTFIIAFTVIINLFMTRGEVIFSFWVFKVTMEGVINAIFMAIRLLLLISATSLMSLTTSPIALTDGMESLMNKVPVLKIFAHELSMMMSIALRFIPTLMEEIERIINAQKARGADFESGNLFSRAKAYIPVLVPLFVSAFQRAEELAYAMEARCYRGGHNRTRLKELKYERNDYISYFIMLICIIAVISINIFLGSV